MGLVCVFIRGIPFLAADYPRLNLFPSILLDHVSKLDYKLALFILLTRLERMLLQNFQPSLANTPRSNYVTCIHVRIFSQTP